MQAFSASMADMLLMITPAAERVLQIGDRWLPAPVMDMLRDIDWASPVAAYASLSSASCQLALTAWPIARNLGTVGFALSVALMVLAMPLVFVTAFQTIWALSGIGVTRKVLISAAVAGLWWVWPACAAALLAFLWAVLTIIVAASAVLLPPAITFYSLAFLLPVAAEFRESERQRPQHGGEDITVAQLSLAVVVGFCSSFFTGTAVVALTVVKSPLVFVSVLLTCAARGFLLITGNAETLGVWTMFLLGGFGVVLCVGVPCLALALAFAAVAELLVATIWPAYVAAGRLQSSATRRQRRLWTAGTFVEAAKAAYLVFWLADIVTNAAISMRPALARCALEEFLEITRGLRRTLSPECQTVSWLPPAVLTSDGEADRMRAELRQVAQQLDFDPDLFEAVWSHLFVHLRSTCQRCVERGLLTHEYLSQAPLALLVGLPALVFFEILLRSPQGEELLLPGDVAISGALRPRGDFADGVWEQLMEAKQAYGRAAPSAAASAQLEAVLLVGGAEQEAVPEPLWLAASSGMGRPWGELPTELAAVQRSLHAVAQAAAKQDFFRRHVRDGVIAPLLGQ